MKVKFCYNGIKVDGVLYRCFYSLGNLINYPADTITIYARDYIRLPKIEGLIAENDTDYMTDYFENDRIRVLSSNPHYNAVRSAYEQRKLKNEKRYGKEAH